MSVVFSFEFTNKLISSALKKSFWQLWYDSSWCVEPRLSALASDMDPVQWPAIRSVFDVSKGMVLRRGTDG